MITAQDIREKTFERSRMNGYDMASVDEFLEDIAASITDMQKENAVLRGKMKVLVDKIEEYRSNEESLNRALMSAQKLAVQIESDARTRANAIVEEARQTADARIGNLEREATEIESRIFNGKKAMADFYTNVRNTYGEQMEKLTNILRGLEEPEEQAEPELPAEDEYVPAEEPPADSIPDYEPKEPVYEPEEPVYESDSSWNDAESTANEISNAVREDKYESAFRFEFNDLKNPSRNDEDQMSFDF